MVCPSCQAEVREGAKFCHRCGTPIATTCPNCGRPYGTGQLFCDECGSRLPAGDGAETSAATPTAARPVEHEPIQASPEMRMVSVLFIDLVGFTSLSEQRDAEDVRELLGQYFEQTRTIIERHGGNVEKFIGDAVMAVWGVPVAREDDAERAVRTALEVVDAVNAFGEQAGATELRARAGVVTGQVAALESPGEGLVVGDRVNTASRVQSAAEPGSVLVDEVTRQVTSSAIAYVDAGEHSVKGKTEPLRLWRAVRVVAGVGGSDREQGLDARFVGRDADLRLIKELFHSALDRRSARLLAVTGDAGVGKSRLRREFFNYIDGLSSTVLWHLGRCLSHGEGVAYWALAEMVRQRLGIAEEASAQETAARLQEGLDRWVPNADDRAFIAPRLGALLGITEPGLGREELFAGWRLFFERLAEHEPVALVFEDLQWADSGLLDFIEQLLDWSSSSPIFMLTLARPELSAGRDAWPAGHRGATLIRLEPLEDTAMRTLLVDLVEDLPKAVLKQIVARAEGVPLYAIETVRALADRGALSERDGRLTLTGEVGELDVPASLSSLLSARLDALSQPERGLVKAMSVFGGSFPRSAAVALGDVAETELDAVLASLVRKGVLVIRTDRLSPDRGQYAFAQSLLRTVAYELLSRQERKLRHLAAAEQLRSAFPNDGEDVAEVIAGHYLDALRSAAGDPDQRELQTSTLEALRRAGRRATTVGAPESAERVYRTALELSDDARERAELNQLAGEAAQLAGRREQAIELLEAAHAAFVELAAERDAARVAATIVRVLSNVGRLGEAADRARIALDRLGGGDASAEAAELNCVLGQALVNAGHYEDAIAALDAALRTAEALKLPGPLSLALTQKANAFLYTGRPEEARLLYMGATEVAERHELTRERGSASGNFANFCTQWDFPEAVEQVQSALLLNRRRGHRFNESIDSSNLMAVFLLTGRWEESERLAQELLGADDERPGAAFLRYRLGLLRVLRGDFDQATDLLGQLSAWESSDDEEHSAMYAAGSVALRLAEGRTDEALAAGLAMLPRAIETLTPATDPVRDAWPAALEAALRTGRLDAARSIVELLASRPPGHVPPYLEAQLARGHALTDALAGEHEHVEAGLQSAIDRFRALGYPYWLAVAETDLAAWLIDQGRASDAGPLLEQAAAVFESLGAAPALARADGLSPQPSETAAG